MLYVFDKFCSNWQKTFASKNQHNNQMSAGIPLLKLQYCKIVKKTIKSLKLLQKSVVATFDDFCRRTEFGGIVPRSVLDKKSREIMVL